MKRYEHGLFYRSHDTAKRATLAASSSAWIDWKCDLYLHSYTLTETPTTNFMGGKSHPVYSRLDVWTGSERSSSCIARSLSGDAAISLCPPLWCSHCWDEQLGDIVVYWGAVPAERLQASPVWNVNLKYGAYSLEEHGN